MSRLTCILEHPIIFVFDFDNENVEVPQYDPDKIASLNEYCLSIRARSDVDGDVTIGLNAPMNDSRTTSMTEAFRGSIGVPNKKLALVNSQNEKLLETGMGSDLIGVRVFVDDDDFPTNIEVSTFSLS